MPTHEEDATSDQRTFDIPIDMVAEAKSNRLVKHSTFVEVSLPEFLSRPVKVATLSWAPGNDVNTAVSLTDYLALTPIKHKLNQFARARFTQCITVSFTASPFYSGSLLLSALPCGSFNELEPARLPLTPVNADFIRLTQRPNVFMSVNQNTTATLKLPWFSPREWFVLNPSEVVDAANPYTISLNSLNQLAHCNGASDPVTVTIFFHLEDLELEVPTTYFAASREYKEVDTKLTRLAKGASALSRVPFLRPYATPMAIAASIGADMAKILGFSKPLSVEDPQIRGNNSMSQTDQPNMVPMMALSSANSISVGGEFNLHPSMLETNIRKLASRYSYLSTLTWTVASAADTQIVQFAVTPSYYKLYGTANEIHFPASCYLSLPFSRWSGTVKFKIQAIASAMHRGRLRITWDPYPTANINTPGFYSTVSTLILDLEKEHEVEMVVPHHSAYYLMKNVSYEFPATPASNKTSSVNGYITISVLNAVTTPNGSVDTPVPINIWIAVGDDFQLYAPTDKSNPYSYYPASKEVGDEQPVERAMMACGECVMDILTLVKRETPTARYPLFSSVTSSVSGQMLYTISDFDRPVFRGRKATGRARYTTTGVLARPFDYAPVSMITHYEMCFAARRGGYTVKYMCETAIPYVLSIVDCDFASDPLGSYPRVDSVTMTTLDATNSAMYPYYWGAGASALEVEPFTRVISARKPYYNQNALLPNAYGLTNWGNASYDDLYGPAHRVRCTIGAGSNSLIRYVGTCDDYQLLFYTGPPIVYNVPSPLYNA